MEISHTAFIKWPARYDVFGVMVSATDYKEAEDKIISAAVNKIPAIIDHMPVYLLMAAVSDMKFREALNSFDIVAPDGHPVRWALNSFYKLRLRDRVYGPDLMLLLCKRASRENISIYLFGSTPIVLEALRINLINKFPGLIIAGAESPPFRKLTEEEDRAIVERINSSGAGLVFVGLGGPKQEIFAFEHKYKIQAVQLCVGAAFDFHAGMKPQAPAWMQKNGLEWLFRLLSEPMRLGPRYLVTNMRFIVKFIISKIKYLGK